MGQKTISRMVQIVLKRNRMQAAALCITYALTFSLLVMLAYFYPSIEKTFDRYLEEYHLPEGTILTELLPTSVVKESLHEEGIRASALRVVLETQISLPNGKTASCRFCSVSDPDTVRFWSVTREEDSGTEESCVLLSSYFAGQNGISPGDSLSVSTPRGWKEVTVTDIVSSPETISVSRNAFSWYDGNDYGLLFIGESLMDELFSCGGFCNRLDLWFDSDTDAAQVLANVERNLGSAVTSAGLYEGSDTQKQIQSSLDSTKAVVTFMPVLLIGMGILFSTMFFIQIVNRGEKRNGMLLAIGYDARRISRIYVRSSLILTLSSALVGLAAGALLLRSILLIYVGTYDLPFVCYDGSLLLLPLLLLIIVLIGTSSSLLACRRLGRLDPVVLFSAESPDENGELPAWISRLRAGAFFKMSLSNIVRNRQRFSLSVLCGMACLVLTVLSVSVIASKNESIRYLFEERFQYDLAVRCSGETALREIASLPGVKRAEQIVELTYDYEEETMLLQALPENAELTGILSVKGEALSVPPEGQILLEEGFARRHRLAAGDELHLGDVTLSVAGITREYYNSIQLISIADAAALGRPERNTVLLALEEGQNPNDFIASASEMDGFLYACSTRSREESVRTILATLDYPCYVFALFSAVIGAVIVSTMNLVTIAQRRKKYAALYVLGTTVRDFLTLELPETVLQFAATVLLGCAPAMLCTKFMLRLMSAPSQEYVVVFPLRTLCISSAVVAAYQLIGIFVTLRAIRNMDYLEILSER